MVAKEIDVAMLAYNLVRAVMYLTAQKAGLEPRAFSFPQVRNVLQAFGPRIAAAADERTARKLYDGMLYYLSQCQLSQRRRSPFPAACGPNPRPTRRATPTKLKARVDLQSTSLNAATYRNQSAVLELEFGSGAIYRYAGVPEQVYRELLHAESKGRYFHQHIRNRFPYAKIDPTRRGPARHTALHQDTA
jgi:hypothetical protein